MLHSKPPSFCNNSTHKHLFITIVWYGVNATMYMIVEHTQQLGFEAIAQCCGQVGADNCERMVDVCATCILPLSGGLCDVGCGQRQITNWCSL